MEFTVLHMDEPVAHLWVSEDHTILSPEALVSVQGSTKGTQPKYLQGNYWYKQDQIGYEGISEALVSKILSLSNVKDFVFYERCIVNGRNGCRSKNFLQTGESYISFQRLHEIYQGSNLTKTLQLMDTAEERIRYVLDFVYSKTKCDCKKYLSQILALDMLILNTDRHLNNLGIVVNTISGESRPAPIFDNGNSLLSDWGRFSNPDWEMEILNVTGQPFSANLEYQAAIAGIGLQLNYAEIEQILEREPRSRAARILEYQLQRYRKVIPDLGGLEKDCSCERM